jgi:peptidoglycan/xylan/chitin deacetylase (PgdA/CDA1 family)
LSSRVNLAAAALDRAGLARVGLRHGGWRGVVGLLHHRIAREQIGEEPVVSTTLAEFEEQLRFLARHCEVIEPSDLTPELLGERGRKVLLSFDDCYRDNYELAVPALVAHGLRATFFLVSGFLDGVASPWWDEIDWMVKRSPRDRLDPCDWWDKPLSLSDGGAAATSTLLARRYRTCTPERGADMLDHLASATGSGRRPPGALSDFVTWEMAREMQAQGMTIGGHTHTHPVLSTLTPEAQQDEIQTSLRRIGEELGARPETFAYPIGQRDAFDHHAKRAAAASGVRLAFSAYGGYSRPGNWDPLDVRRMPLGPEWSLAAVRWTASLPAVFARA